MPVYIGKKWRFGRVTLMPHSQTTEYNATQLVQSVKFKLSHAIQLCRRNVATHPIQQWRPALHGDALEDGDAGKDDVVERGDPKVWTLPRVLSDRVRYFLY